MQIYGFTEYGGPEAAGFLDVPAPELTPDGVLIAVEATTVNPGDIKVRSGARSGAFPVRFPMAMGREAAGTILALGPEAPGDLAVGQRVFGSAAPGVGTFAEQTVLTGASTTPIPPGLSAGTAASIPVAFGTAFDALAALALRPGEPLLVLGAGGGVGTSTLSLAQARGLTVWGVASAGKRDIVEGFGALHVPSGPGWESRAAALGAPAAVFDLVGGEVLRAGAALLEGTRLISIADAQAAAELGGAGVERRRTREVYSEIAHLLAASAAKPCVSARYRLAEAARAVADVESGHAAGKVIIRV